ncbi:serine hydrolase domain-containing protein [Streptomyces sp. C10-9-1]|uniref:serine hydrolase domain-containing protein n=1 Tax=Streptomyces sp. C10-9-1 TaxID=1859285 RepID=UPI003D75390B
MTATTARRLTARRAAAAALAVAALITGAAPAAAAAPAPAPAGTAAAPPAAGPGAHQATQEALDAAVAAGAPGAVAGAVRGHRAWRGTAGAADLDTGKPRTPRDRFRVGSITKTFVATVLLQLEAEGRIDLDESVGSRLPGLVEGNGHDDSQVTIRQLLNHTSGIADYTADPDFGERVFGSGFPEHRYDTWTPQSLVRTAMKHAPDFPPGTAWGYSNTNYVLAGLVIEEVTGRPYGREIERRILRPLHLRATSVPGTSAAMPRPSARAYSTLGGAPSPDRDLHDVTELNPSIAHAAGEMISDTRDLQRFYRALFSGRLLPEAQMAALTDTVEVSPQAPEVRYGLGVMWRRLDCGTEIWGHGGGIHGSLSQVAVTEEATHSVALNLNGDFAGDTAAVVRAEFCGGR